MQAVLMPSNLPISSLHLFARDHGCHVEKTKNGWEIKQNSPDSIRAAMELQKQIPAFLRRQAD